MFNIIIDYEKAFDGIKIQILFDILKPRNISDTLLKAVLDIHTQNKMLIKFKSELPKLAKLIKQYAKVFLACPHCLIIYT